MIHGKKMWFGLLLVLMTCAVAEISTRANMMRPVDHIWYDIWHQIDGKRYDPKHVIIVSIDDATLMTLKDDPLVFWGPHFAKAIQTLRDVGVPVIGIDFLFSVSIEAWLNKLNTAENNMSRIYDIPMREQLNAGNVILLGMVVTDSEHHPKLMLPINEYLYALPGGPMDVGLANLYVDSDEIIRHFIPRLFPDANPGMTFAALLAKRFCQTVAHADQLPNPETWDTDTRPRVIGYAGPPGTFPRISFQLLLQPDALSDPRIQALRNKLVIIASEHSLNHDRHLTPYIRSFVNRRSGLMSGPEIHANIVETLLTGNYPKHIPVWIRIGVLLVITTMGFALFSRWNPLLGMVGLFLGCILTCGMSWLLFTHNWQMPITHMHVSLAMVYVGALSMRLFSAERSRRRIQRALGPYVSKNVMDKLLASGSLPNLGGETLRITVLFSDIRGFTTISEKLQPHEVVDMLNQYYSRVYEPIQNYGGIVDKFIGDAVMAIFGAPMSYSDQATRCIQAAMEMTQIAKNFQTWIQEKFPDRGLPEFRIGVGIHSGDAVVGNIGAPSRMAYTAIGDTVNIASRLESMSKSLKWTVVASKATVDASGPRVITGQSQMVTPSGRSGQIEVMEILGIHPESKPEKEAS